MHEDQAPYRELFEALHARSGRASVFDDLLVPWLERHPEQPTWLESFGARGGAPVVPPATIEDLWRLYALGRVFDTLALGLQSGRADGTDWPGPPIAADEFDAFARALGLEVSRPVAYTPFHHEIAGLLEDDDPDRGVDVLEVHWPCLMLGPLLFMRSGVTVSAGSKVLRPGVADRSKLYWAYRRKTRPCEDLSHGWGSNSQWRTRLRRDYALDGGFHFNVDGRIDLALGRLPADDGSGLDLDERRELLMNRCFVVTDVAGRDPFPYDDRLHIPRA